MPANINNAGSSGRSYRNSLVKTKSSDKKDRRYDHIAQVTMVYDKLVDKISEVAPSDNNANLGDNADTHEKIKNINNLKQNIEDFKDIRKEIKNLSKQINSPFFGGLDGGESQFPILEKYGVACSKLMKTSSQNNSFGASDQASRSQSDVHDIVDHLIKLIAHTNGLHCYTLGAMGGVTTGSEFLLNRLDRKIEELEGTFFANLAYLFEQEVARKSPSEIKSELEKYQRWLSGVSLKKCKSESTGLGYILDQIKGDNEHRTNLVRQLIKLCVEAEGNTLVVVDDSSGVEGISTANEKLVRARNLKRNKSMITSLVNRELLLKSNKSKGIIFKNGEDITCKSGEVFSKLHRDNNQPASYTTEDNVLTIEDLFDSKKPGEDVATNSYFTKTKYIDEDKPKIVNPNKSTITLKVQDNEKTTTNIYSCGSFYGKFTKDIFGRKLTTKSNGTKQTFFAKSAETFIKKIFKDHSSGEDTVVFDVRFLALVDAPLGGRQNSEFTQHKRAMRKGMEFAGKEDKYFAFGLNVGNDTNQKIATTGLNTKSIKTLKRKLDDIEKNKGVTKLSIAEQFAYHKLRILIGKGGDKLTERHNAPLFLSCLTLLEKELDIILVCGCLHAKDRTSSVILTSKAISALAVEAKNVTDMDDFFDKDLYASPKWEEDQYKHITKTFDVDKEFLWHINGSSCGVETNVNSRVIKSFLKKTKNIILKSYFNEVQRISISG